MPLIVNVGRVFEKAVLLGMPGMERACDGGESSSVPTWVMERRAYPTLSSFAVRSLKEWIYPDATDCPSVLFTPVKPEVMLPLPSGSGVTGLDLSME